MTKNSDLKRRVRERMAKTGESYAAARAQGIPVETLMSEYAPGQFELTLAHRDDALRAVDEAILLKRLLRGVAAKHGKVVTFMAKPYADLAGSGMHIHVSLAGSDGSNPGERVSRAGFDWRVVAENVAAGQTSADDIAANPGQQDCHDHSQRCVDPHATTLTQVYRHERQVCRT